MNPNVNADRLMLCMRPNRWLYLTWVGAAATSSLMWAGVAQASPTVANTDTSILPIAAEAPPEMQRSIEVQSFASSAEVPTSKLTKITTLPSVQSDLPTQAPEDLLTETESEATEVEPDSLEPAAQSAPPSLTPLVQASTSTDLTNADTDLNLTYIAQVEPVPPSPSTNPVSQAGDLAGTTRIQVQGAYVLQGDESSARTRVTGLHVITPDILVGATVDLTGGDTFSDSREEGLNLNELYVTIAPSELQGLRVVAGLMDLTSYFDRNSFAKDGVTHFFNPVFQTNPALAVAGIGSRPGLLVNWSVTDSIELRAATFSSSRNLDEFALDAYAGEIGLRLGNAIIRGTYVSDRDAGKDDGFQEIFQIPRSGGGSGLSPDDRETAYGINAEYFIPSLNLGFFGRYGWYENRDLDRTANTYSFGFNFLDLLLRDDRLGLAYGQQLSNDDLRRAQNDKAPTVMELFYDARLTPNLRAGVTVQERNEFSETVFGFRIRADFDVTGLGRRL